MIRQVLASLVLLASLGPTAAQDRCAEFAWPLHAEQALLSGAPEGENGTTLPIGQGRRVTASPLAQARLPARPERGGPEVRAAFLQVGAAPSRVQVTLSDDAWVDIVQDGRFLRSLGSTGHRGCLGLRKSIRFETGGAPFVVQLSGPDLNSIAVVVTPAQ